MSSDTFIAYFGLRFELSADEIEAVELRSDPRIVAARRAGWNIIGEILAGLLNNIYYSLEKNWNYWS